MLGDVAVAVNADDERYKKFHGKMLRLPLTGREIPVITDEWANPEFGTGAVKVTPAHDPNDFAIGQRHDLPSINVMDGSAHIELPGSPYRGPGTLSGADEDPGRPGIAGSAGGRARAQQLRGQVRPLQDDRGAAALQAVVPRSEQDAEAWRQLHRRRRDRRGGKGFITFTPEQYRKTYDEWMKNIHDWCLSRQLWWGHRIPAWHCAKCGEITVARETPMACGACGAKEITQETDVLDTWFSSGLLPFTVFGWPQQTPDLAAFYPTDLLVTGFDILFFWVARMIMLGCHFMLDVPMPDGSQRSLENAVPFREVYIHALVRDADRQKMSKTKGNVIDPIEIIEHYGTDAVRFTLASMASPGTDIAFSEARTEGNRAFANKIWNSARFVFMQVERGERGWHYGRSF